MSLSSYYSEVRSFYVTFEDGTSVYIALDIPLELTLNFSHPDFSDDNVIEFDNETKSKLQKDYVRNWIKTFLRGVIDVTDDWDEDAGPDKDNEEIPAIFSPSS